MLCILCATIVSTRSSTTAKGMKTLLWLLLQLSVSRRLIPFIYVMKNLWLSGTEVCIECIVLAGMEK
ncbi:hypothetical protein LguiB_032601 [Lonicera macranthoides]